MYLHTGSHYLLDNIGLNKMADILQTAFSDNCGVFIKNFLPKCLHYNDVIWARWRLKSPASQLFTEAFIRVQIKENIKALRHWPLLGKFTGDRWIPRTKGQ